MEEPTYACSLTDEELAARRREWRALEKRALLRTEDRPGGRMLVYQGGEHTAQVLAALIEAERRCCPFLDFSIDQEDGEVRLRIGFPPENREVVEAGILGAD